MRLTYLRFTGFFLAVLTLGLSACAEKTGAPEMPDSMKHMQGQGATFSSTAALPGEKGPRVVYNGKEVSSVKANTVDTGMVIPDGKGGVIWLPGEPRQPQNAGYAEAREIKLKIREMTEQLISGIKDPSLRCTVALPTSFVNLDNFEQSSSFGRLFAEQLIYEFNQRGYPVKEYRAPKNIRVREGEGELYLTRALGDVSVPPDGVVVAGTYYADKQAVFVNARLLRPSDGRVMRTANLVLSSNSLTRRMLAGGTGTKLDTGVIHFRDFKEAVSPVSVNPVDRGADIH